ncbi:L-idonate 5-dehydrogenase [Ideonella sp. A 288]|uniref:L-idonate 5-dehydrogenase n=1 Tax=Ideonella sp. A 288 TaxID=1962181 RepID=UPI000B4B1FCF|nr:L-idonate 5-dehydrogenase [Ideonella sp. A 288]
MSLACLIHGALDLRLEQETPRALGANDVLLRLGAGGICGSDLHYYKEGRVGAFVVREPLVPGHEASGVVVALGDAVTRVAIGQKVAINPSHACGRCSYCREGRGNLCRQMFFLGSASVFPHAQGMFRERFVMGEAQLTPITEPGISLGEIACAEPLSIGLHALHRAGPVLGETVLVTGGGTIGCMSVMAARLAGAAQVIVCDINDRALEMARTVGADRTIRSDQASAAELADLAEVSIEAAGSPAALATCLTATRRGGRIVQVGTLPAEVAFPANSVMARELDYRGAFRAHLEFDWAVQAIRSRRVDVRPLISAQLPLADSKQAFELALDRTRSTKVQLVAD